MNIISTNNEKFEECSYITVNSATA